MLSDQSIINLYGPFSTTVADFLQSVGFMKGSKKWLLVVTAFVATWLWQVARRQKSTIGVLNSDGWFLGLLAFGIFMMRLPALAYSHMDVDEAEWMVGAATIAQDPRFWLSVDGTTSGPISIMSLSLIPWLGGSLSYASVRLFSTLVYLIPSVWLTYYALRHLTSRFVADIGILPLAALIGTAHSLIVFSGEAPIMLLTAASLYLYSRFSETTLRLPYLFWFGFVVGLLVFSKPQAIPMGMLIALAGLWKINFKKWQWRPTVAFAMGGLMPTILVAIYLTASGLWYDFMQSYIYNNLFYGGPKGAMGNNYSLVEVLRQTKQYLHFVDDYTYLFFTAQIAALLSLVAIFQKGWPRFSPSQRDWLFMALLFGVAIFCTVKPQTFFYHYQNMLLIPAVCLLAVTLQWVSISFNDANNALNFKGIAIVFVIVNVVLATFLASTYKTDPLVLDSKRTNVSEVTRVIEANSKPNDKMAVWGWNTPMFIETGLLQGTRDGHTHYHMSPITLQQYYINRYLSDLKRNQPQLVVETFSGYSALVFGKDGRKEFGFEHFPTIYQYIQQHYVLKADVEGHTRIFVKK
jgi:hypothetical protein